MEVSLRSLWQQTTHTPMAALGAILSRTTLRASARYVHNNRSFDKAQGRSTQLPVLVLAGAGRTLDLPNTKSLRPSQHLQVNALFLGFD